jgi:hypothetical protein
MMVTDNAVPPRTSSHEITVTVNNSTSISTYSTPQSAHHSSNNCGATGIELLFLYSLLAIIRRRLRTA